MKPICTPWDEGLLRHVLKEFLLEVQGMAEYAAKPFGPNEEGGDTPYFREQHRYWNDVAAAMRWAFHLADTQVFERVLQNGTQYIEPSPDQQQGDSGDSSPQDSTRSGNGGDPFTD